MSRSSAIGASRSASCHVPASIQALASSAVRRIAAPHARSSEVTRAMWARRRSLTSAHTGNPDAWSWTMSEDDVVDQLGFAHPYRTDCGITVSHIVHALEGVSVHGCELPRRKPRHSL